VAQLIHCSVQFPVVHSAIKVTLQCILRLFYKKKDEAFTFIALEKGLHVDTKKKMDAVKVEAMLSEARLCNDNLIRHLNNFLARDILTLKIRGVLFFADSDLPPIVDKIVLPDKTIVDFWYKEPDKMLQH
jgi:hypothetical protein